MPFVNHCLRPGDRSLYDNSTRQEWSAKTKAVKSLDQAVKMLVDFRTEHVGPERASYSLECDALWIEAEIERRVNELRSQKFPGLDYLTMCADGRDAAKVKAEKMAELDAAAADQSRLESLSMQYRRELKAPIMPVDFWLPLESHASKRLLEIRAKTLDAPTPPDILEWRKKRGCKVLVAGHGNAMT